MIINVQPKARSAQKRLFMFRMSRLMLTAQKPFGVSHLAFKKTEIPLSLHQECKGTSSNYGFLSFNIFRKERHDSINRDGGDEERGRLQRHLRGEDDVQDVPPSLRVSPQARGEKGGTCLSSHQFRATSPEWCRLP